MNGGVMWSKIVTALTNREDPNKLVWAMSYAPTCRACDHEYRKPYVNPWRGVANRIRAWRGKPAKAFLPKCPVLRGDDEWCFCDHPFHAPRG